MNVNNEVTAADIARIAGVGRAAVSNWRRRHPDFPTPVGGPANSPTFAWSEVEAWLNANGRTGAANAPPAARAKSPITGLEELADPMAALVPRLDRGMVFDPACASGTLLATVARRLGPAVHYLGQDDDPALAEAARGALADAGATGVEIVTGNGELASLPRDADVVVLATPATERPADGFPFEYGQPNRADHALAWVQIGLSCLKPGGTAIVAVPFPVAVRSSGRRIRAELLRAGVLTQVIALPERIVSTTSVPWQIWVLTRPVGRPTYVLKLVDLTDRRAGDLPTSDAAWAAVFADPAHTRDVPSIEVLDEEVLLVPAAHIAVEARDLTPDYVRARERYAAAADRLGLEAPTLPDGDGLPGPLVSVGDLIRAGAVTMVDRDTAQAGDVVVPWNSGDFTTTVLAASPDREIKTASLLRCDPEMLDPYFLACFLRSETNRRQAAGTSGGTFRLDVRRARVPRMPMSDQRHYGEAFRRLMAFTADADEAADAARAAARIAVDGLTSGVFAPPHPESELSS